MLSMNGPRRSCSGLESQEARDQARAGFTLVELVLVLLLVVILSGLAVPSLSGLSQAKANVTATRVRSLVVFAQQWAIGTDRPTWVGYDPATQQLNAFQARAVNTAFAWRVALNDPLTHAALSIDLTELFGAKDPIQDYYGSSNLTLKFDPTGAPVDSSDVPLKDDVLIPLSDGIGVRIRAGTGLISVL